MSCFEIASWTVVKAGHLRLPCSMWCFSFATWHGKVPVSDRQVLDRPGVCAEELLKQFGVVTTVGDLLPALQQRKLLASKEHLAAASRLAGASDSIGLQQCYAVHLTPEDSERLKMPFDRYVPD